MYASVHQYVSVVINGKLERKSCGSSKVTAEGVLAKMLEARAVNKVTGDTQLLEQLFKKRERKTFREAAADYMDERPELADNTKRCYNEILKNRLLPAFGDLYVDQITEKMISKFKAAITDEVSATRVNNILGPLRYILKFCVTRKLIVDNPAAPVKPLREEDPDIDPLTMGELDKVIAALRAYQRPLFTCLAWTGARPNELFALKWPDVDFHRNEIKISKGSVRGKEGKTKTKKSKRVIPMLSIVRDTLLEVQKGPIHLKGYVFLNKHGQPYQRHVDREWRTALTKAKVKHRPSYQLRHTFASLCLQNGLQPTWVANVLGHSSAAITFKHYARYIADAGGYNEKRLEDYLKAHQSTKTISSINECG